MSYIRLLDPEDAEQIAAYYRRNDEFHRPWSPLIPAEAFTAAFHRERLNTYQRFYELGLEYRFGIFTKEGKELMIGSISLSSVERGVFQNGRLGYSIDTGYTGKGVMTNSLQDVIGFAFDDLALHRLEANIMPRNTASRRVLEKCGFTKIGMSPRMLYISGQWEDHDMYMLLAGGADDVG